MSLGRVIRKGSLKRWCWTETQRVRWSQLCADLGEEHSRQRGPCKCCVEGNVFEAQNYSQQGWSGQGDRGGEEAGLNHRALAVGFDFKCDETGRPL